MGSPRESAKRPRSSKLEKPEKKARKLSGNSRPFESPLVLSSSIRAQRAFQWLLSPITVKQFFSTYFERKPLHLHHRKDQFSSLFSVAEFSKLVHSGAVSYGTALDVTSYNPKSGRETLNEATGSRVGAEAWAKFNKGCSLRLLRPQASSDALWSLCALLEAFFECAVGANVYLTPGSTQGFAPHFDDIDAFVCQVSGRKHWRVYSPAASGHDVLPRGSSIDFAPDDLRGRALVVDAVLEPGDLLYLPRGAVHEARAAAGDEPSLHVTLSAAQRWTWADFLLDTVHTAIRSAAATDVELRRSLPLRFGRYMGQGRVAHDEPRRERFDRALRGAMRRVSKAYPVDAAADIMAERFLADRLPPPPSVMGAKPTLEKKVGLGTRVRAVAEAVARVVVADDGLPKLIHCIGNERGAWGERSAQELRCLPEEAGAVDFIIKMYPGSVEVGEVPMEKEDERVELVEGLAEMGLVKVL